MSLLGWARGGPKTTPAPEPTVQGPQCVACHTPDVPMVPVQLGEFGAWPVCELPSACRQRAQLVGLWCIYPRET